MRSKKKRGLSCPAWTGERRWICDRVGKRLELRRQGWQGWQGLWRLHLLQLHLLQRLGNLLQEPRLQKVWLGHSHSHGSHSSVSRSGSDGWRSKRLSATRFLIHSLRCIAAQGLGRHPWRCLLSWQRGLELINQKKAKAHGLRSKGSRPCLGFGQGGRPPS